MLRPLRVESLKGGSKPFNYLVVCLYQEFGVQMPDQLGKDRKKFCTGKRGLVWTDRSPK
jgi:hypothetical protein